MTNGSRLLAAVILLLAGCEADDAVPPAGAAFVEVAAATGLVFRHVNGAGGAYYQPEIFGPGVALLDYDGDGDLDIYLPQANRLDAGQSTAAFPPSAGQPPGDRLFRNELVPGGTLHFTDVTAAAGLGRVGYSQGVATGDYDNDGNTDLYVTGFGSNVLYHNEGDGRFTDVTAAAGVDDPRWSTSAAFLDYDRDGDLDLFVANYVRFTVAGNKQCAGADGKLDYCGPQSYEKVRDRLFRNDGDGRFTDVSDAAGLGAAFGPGLGVTCADFNGDGWLDIYVANDGDDNQLWINRQDGSFENTALMSGVAINAYGKAEASMGVTAGDFDGDGDEDLFMTHLNRETNTLYVNDGNGNFLDVTDARKLGRISLPYTGFGSEWFDYDNDGDLDLFVANGAVKVEESQRGQPFPYRERNQLIRNDGADGFTDVTEAAGPALALVEVSRGAAFGDVDNDGAVDIVVANNNGPTRLLRNVAGTGHHWLTVQLRGTHANRAGLGARVAVLRADHSPLWRRVHTDGSYLSANDPRVHFGLGKEAGVRALGVVWPDGSREIWRDIPVDTFITLQEGSGAAWAGKD
jgi:enediyne biosynthesis protein E4